MKNKIEYKKGKLDLLYSSEDGIIEKIDNNFYFDNTYTENGIYLCSYDKNSEDICYRSSTFNDNIYSVSISKEKNKIYACLSNKKIVTIIDYDLDKEEFTNIQNIIDDTNDSLLHFNKCINISNGLLATSDDKNIIIWKKIKNGINNYSNIRNIEIYGKTNDLLFTNDEYFVSSQPDMKTITLININNLNPEKYIPNIDCIDSLNCFIKLKDYIIINCKRGIALLLIKTKEIIQYIENSNGITENKQICLDNKDNICII